MALPVWARATSAPIVDQLELRHYYLDPGVDASVDQMEDLVSMYPDIYFVGLADEVASGSDALAGSLLEELGEGSVVVLTPEEIGAVSSAESDTRLNAALDAVAATAGGSYSSDFEEFAAGISGQPPATVGSSGARVVPILVGVGLVGLVGLVFWRGSRRQKRAATGLADQAREEIKAQMDVIASQIVQLADDPRVEQYPEAVSHYRAASDTYGAAESRLQAATTAALLEDLSDDLDRARWELEATQALIEGRAPPPQPVDEKPQTCFFDPTHGIGVEEAQISTPAGNRKVMVCESDAEKLNRGEAPEPRNIPYGPDRVPAPQAPRSHGGLGMDWLDFFSVIVGGMGNGIPYDWSRTQPRSPSGRGTSGSGGSLSRGTASRGTRGRARGSR
jgi:hypothetical protein